jgi:hypothetical protein
MSEYVGAYSPTREPFSGTAVYLTDDGREVEVTMITTEKEILDRYLKENPDAIVMGRIKKDTFKKGKAWQAETVSD